MVQVKNCFSHGERLVSWAVRHTASLGFGFWNIYLIFHIQSRGIIHSFFFKVFIYLSAWGLSWGMWDLQSSLYCNRIFSCSVWILSCGMWDLVSWLGIEPQPPALGAWNLSHWTTREVPQGHCSFTTVFPPCCCCCCQVASVVFNSVQPHRWQPTRLPRPWDSPGKNTGVGCHFLLQCRKVKSESEVAQSCPALSDPMDCSLPGSSAHGIFQARVLEWGTIAFSKDLLFLLVG